MRTGDFEEMVRDLNKGADVDQEELVEALGFASSRWHEIQDLTKALCAGYAKLQKDLACKDALLEEKIRQLDERNRQIWTLKAQLRAKGGVADG